MIGCRLSGLSASKPRIQRQPAAPLVVTCAGLLLFCFTASAYETGIPLRAFSATYDLRKGKRLVAKTEFRLERNDEHWVWRSLTRARGFYAWFVRKKPESRTRFSQQGSDIRLHDILITDGGNDKNPESARFDWATAQLQVQRKGKQKQIDLTGAVYDYQSIHLLAALMRRQNRSQAFVDFYHKGKLAKSTFDFRGRENIMLDEQGIEARLFEQTIADSRTRIRYYYSVDHPFLPLRIETRKGDKSPTVLNLRRVEWRP